MVKIIYCLMFAALIILTFSTHIFSQDFPEERSLQYFLEQGIRNSPLIRDNLNSLEMNKIDSLINIAANKPFIQSTANYLYAPTSKSFGYDEAITNGGQYTGLLQVSRNLLYRKNLKIQNRLNSAVKDSLFNSLRMNQNDLQKAIIDLYLIGYQDYSQMVIFRDLYTILSKQNGILKELVNSSFFTQSDFLAFRVDLRQSEINWQTAKVQYLQDLLSLNIICNINDTSLVRLAVPDLEPSPMFGYEENPYFLRYKYDSVVVQRNRRMIDIYYRPQLNLTGNVGINAITAANVPNTFGYSVMLDFFIPIYNGNQRKYQYQKMDIAIRTIGYYKNQYITKLNLKLKTIDEQLKVNQNMLLLIEEQNRDVENLLKISQARLYGGDMSAIDYLLIVQRYLNIKLNVNQLRIQRQRLISEFNYRSW